MALSLTKDKSTKSEENSNKEHLSEELKTPPTPPRGKGGKFMSSKKTKKTNKKAVKPSEPREQEPTVTTFYGKPVRRFYYDKKWYFSIGDIVALAAADSLNQKINFGDEKKLAKARKDVALEFTYKDNSGEYILETAQAPELIEMIPYIRGLYPGQFKRWIIETSNFPPPVKEKSINQTDTKPSLSQVHPSDTGNA